MKQKRTGLCARTGPMPVLLMLNLALLVIAAGHPIATLAAKATPASQLSAKRVVLDPGHGWRNAPGAVANGMREADITLDVATRARRILEDYGIQVALTRTGYEPDVGLEAADDRANAFRPDVVVSIHVNAGGGSGTESCYVVDKPTSSESRRLAVLLTSKVSDRLDLRIRGNFPETPATPVSPLCIFECTRMARPLDRRSSPSWSCYRSG